MLLIYAVALGIIAGLMTRGRLSALGSVHIKLWPVALIGSVVYSLFIYKHYSGKVKPLEDTQSPY